MNLKKQEMDPHDPPKVLERVILNSEDATEFFRTLFLYLANAKYQDLTLRRKMVAIYTRTGGKVCPTDIITVDGLNHLYHNLYSLRKRDDKSSSRYELMGIIRRHCLDKGLIKDFQVLFFGDFLKNRIYTL